MSFKKFLGYKAVKWIGGGIMIFSIFLIIKGITPPTGFWSRPVGNPNYSVSFAGILLFIFGWVVFQYGIFKEVGEYIAGGVIRGLSKGREHSGDNGVKSIESKERRIIFDDFIEINGREYDCYSFKSITGNSITIKIRVEEPYDINFYILSKETFLRWKKNEPNIRAYVSRPRISQEEIKWVPPKSGEYCFLFDNTYSQYKKRCKVQIFMEK